MQLIDKYIAIDKSEQESGTTKEDLKTKQQFRENLDKSLYDSHKEFISNPLLLTIMMMTYSTFGEVPERIHVFYSKAYETMSRLHDATKGTYVRPLHTHLTPEDFAKYFSALCALTYEEECYNFTEQTFSKFMDEANIIIKILFCHHLFLYRYCKLFGNFHQVFLDVNFSYIINPIASTLYLHHIQIRIPIRKLIRKRELFFFYSPVALWDNPNRFIRSISCSIRKTLTTRSRQRFKLLFYFIVHLTGSHSNFGNKGFFLLYLYVHEFLRTLPMPLITPPIAE